MGDLTEMRAAACARLVQATLEADVLERIDAFKAGLDALGVTSEVLQLDTDQIEINVVIGSSSSSASRPVCEPAPVVPACGEDAGARKIASGRWSDAEVARAHKMLDGGATSGAIAKALGRGPNAVSVKVSKMRAQRGDAKWRAAREGEATAPPPPRTAPAKRKLVPGKDRVKKAPEPKASAATPVAAVEGKAERPSASVPFAERAGVASLPTRAAPVSGASGERPYAERAIIAHLDGVGYVGGWDAARDFELVEELCRGSNLAVVAMELGVAIDAARARWQVLNRHIGDADHQARLVRILRERSGA